MVKNILSLLLVAGLFIRPEPADAIPPPPFDRHKADTDRAMGALAPFLGSWKSSAPNSAGGSPVRNLWRLGNVILYVVSGDQPVLVNIISYDPWRHLYLLHLAGYRNTYVSRAKELVNVTRPNSSAIQWTFPSTRFSTDEKPGDILETISIEDGKWHENMEFRRAGEAPGKIPEIILEKVGPAKIDVLMSK